MTDIPGVFYFAIDSQMQMFPNSYPEIIMALK